MEEQRRDLAHLIEFLEYAQKNGYVMPGTANNRKRVVNRIFDTLQNVDTSDVTKLNLNDIFDRYSILTANRIPVATLHGYRAHLNSAIREFNSYLTNPSSYRPSVNKTKKPKSSKALTANEKNSPSIEKPTETINQPSAQTIPNETQVNSSQPKFSPSLHIDIQVHISPQSSDTQIDKVFESMAKHLKDLYNNTQGN